MEQEMGVVTIDDKDYLIMKKIKFKENIFVYLSNVLDEDDVLIKKMRDDKFVSLESVDEFELACNIFLQNFVSKNKEDI